MPRDVAHPTPSAARALRHPERAPLLALGMIALVAALWGGLVRLGWQLPGTGNLALLHGPLMVSGFLGTVIGLERAVACGRPWAYAAPLLAGLGAAGLIAGIPHWPGALLMTAGSAVVIAVFALALRAHRALHTQVMTAGALAWLTGNLLWMAGQPLFTVVYWWLAFLVLTILGERLELNRLLPPARRVCLSFVAALAVFVAGVLPTFAAPDLGARLAGAGAIALTAWLLRFDIARRTIRQTGLVRFVAACLIFGYLWLGIGGAILLTAGHTAAGPVYDAALHALFVGFVFSMIFAHAPIIFPAILGVVIDYRPRFYLHVALLHFALIARVAGDLGGWMALREWGGLLNAVAILLFLANTVSAVRRGAVGANPSSPPSGIHDTQTGHSMKN